MPAQQALRRPAVLAALAFVLTVAVFWPAREFDFVDVDDAAFVTDNPWVQEGLTRDSVSWAFTEFHASNWVPGTFLSLMLDRELYGPGPAGFHLTNLLLHGLNAALLLLVVHRLTGHGLVALAVALLWALHPMRVESVAWVSERKDVLSTAFWWLTTLAWLAWVRHRRRRDYLLTLLLFAAGLATKGMLVTLPLTLLVLDWWPLRRTGPWRGRVVEKLPLFALALAGAAMTLLAQGGGTSVTALEMLGPADRLANAVVGWATYPLRLLWPVDLSYFYPHPAFVPPHEGWGAATVASAVLFLLAVTAVGVTLARRGQRSWLAGWAWYLFTLLPVIGLVQVGMQATADRYSYVPHVGLLAMVVGGAAVLVRRQPSLRRPMVAAATAVVIAGTTLTVRELPHWRDSEALFTRAIEVTDDNGVALAALGGWHARQGRLDEARLWLERAVRAQPRYAEAHANLGIVLVALGDDEPAEAELRQALRARPDHARARVALGNLLARRGQPTAAADQYRAALGLDDGLWEAHYGLGMIARLRGREDAARQHLSRALESAPDEEARRQVRAQMRP